MIFVISAAAGFLFLYFLLCRGGVGCLCYCTASGTDACLVLGLGKGFLLLLLVEVVGLDHLDFPLGKHEDDLLLLGLQATDELGVGLEMEGHLIADDAMGAGMDRAGTGERDVVSVDGKGRGVALADAYPAAFYPTGDGVGGVLAGEKEVGGVVVAGGLGPVGAAAAEVEHEDEEEGDGNDAAQSASLATADIGDGLRTDIGKGLLVVGGCVCVLLRCRR